MTLTGREKATIFLSILGAEGSARVLRYLPEELADLIASGINHLPSPSPEALSEVLDEFNSYLALPQATPPVPEPTAEGKPAPVSSKKNFSLLLYERPQMIAYLVSLLPEERQAEALMSIPKERATVEELIAELKSNSLTPKLAAKLKELYKDKLFS